MNHRLKRALYQKRRFHHAMCTNGLCWSPITLTATGGHPCHWSGGGSCGLSWRCIYWHCHYLPCFRPPKTNKAPENGWLEDYIPFEMIPFLGDMLVFGVAFFSWNFLLFWLSLKQHETTKHLHLGRLTAGSPTAITHEKKGKMIWTKPAGNYVPAVNLQGCRD